MIGSITTKAHEKKIGKSSRGHSQGVSQILGHLYRGHSFLVIYVFTFTFTLYRKTSNRSPLCPWLLLNTRLVLETRRQEVLRVHNALSVWAPPPPLPPLSLLAVEIAVYEGGASQQGRGWEQKGGEVANWKMLAPPYDNSDLILHKSR